MSRSTLKSLQQVLDAVEDIARPYRHDRKVSKALHTLYQAVANAGSEIIDKMTRDQDEAVRLERERKERERRERHADERK